LLLTLLTPGFRRTSLTTASKEIRNLIYKLTSSSNEVNSASLQFLMTCKQINAEASAMAWSKTIFRIDSTSIRVIRSKLVALSDKQKDGIVIVELPYFGIVKQEIQKFKAAVQRIAKSGGNRAMRMQRLRTWQSYQAVRSLGPCLNEHLTQLTTLVIRMRRDDEYYSLASVMNYLRPPRLLLRSSQTSGETLIRNFHKLMLAKSHYRTVSRMGAKVHHAEERYKPGELVEGATSFLMRRGTEDVLVALAD